MKTIYQQYATIPLKFNFINSVSGTDQDIIFNVNAGVSLSSSTGGLVKYSIFNGGTTGVAISSLNGSALPLENLYAVALSSSGNYALGLIVEGLTGGIINPTPYDVSVIYKLDNPANFSVTEITQNYTFYVSSTINGIDPRSV